MRTLPPYEDKYMEVMKIYSEMEGEENLYSVLMSEEELALFSDIKSKIPHSKAADKAYKEWENNKTQENARKYMEIWNREVYIPARKNGIFVDLRPSIVNQAFPLEDSKTRMERRRKEAEEYKKEKRENELRKKGIIEEKRYSRILRRAANLRKVRADMDINGAEYDLQIAKNKKKLVSGQYNFIDYCEENSKSKRDLIKKNIGSLKNERL